MNGLSLRISNVRANENVKKNSEIRMDLFQVPSVYLTADNSYLDQLNSSETIEGQVRILKEYSSFVVGLEDSLKLHVQTLANLFMEAPLKHAVRHTIARSLSNLTASREIVAISIANSIKARIEQDSSASSEPTRRNTTICNIGSCFENFKVGCEAVRLSLQQLFQFLNKSVIVYLERMNDRVSPSDKSELCLFIHSAIRIVICCFQQFPDQLKASYEGEKNVEKLVLICWDLLENPEIPMDTKTNCGILIAMNANLERRFLRLAQRVFDEDSSAKQMCLVNGIICTIENEHFTSPEWKGIEVLHQAATVLKEISEENSVEVSIVLGTTRGFFQMTKRLLGLKLDGYKTSERKELVDILAINLRYSLSHLDHYVDSIRHISRDLLKCTIQLGTRLDDTLNTIIYDYIRNGGININTKCILISAISSILKAKEVLRAIPDVPEFLLRSLTHNDHSNTNLHINNCYESLMMSYSYENNKQEWFNRWINPILMEITNGREGSIGGAIETVTTNFSCTYETEETTNNDGNRLNDIRETLHDLIRKAIRAYPEIAINMIDSKVGISYGLVLSSLGIARKNGLFDTVQSTEAMWKNLLSYSDIREAMISSDDSTRMSALYLITECHKSTEIFTKQDLECILFFLETNINVQAASLRQKITSCMKSALNRLRSGFLSIIKKSDIDGKSHYYYEFVKRLHEFCIVNQFIGANYSRRAISFQILLQLLQISSYIFYDDENISMWNERQVRILLSSLNDSYESNKHYSLKVLSFCPKQFIEQFNGELNYEVTRTLMISPRPNDSLSAAYYLEYLCFVNSTIDTPRLEMEPASCSVAAKVYRCFLWCEEILMQGFRLASHSLLRASRENPMFGALICIRHLLSKLDFKELSRDECWRTSITRLISTCDSIAKVVSVVTNNSSPEGTFLDDFQETNECTDIEMDDGNELPPQAEINNSSIPSEMNDEANKESKTETTPQMILLCAWRTIKEISLILGDIASRSPIIETGSSVMQGEKGLLTCQQILSIGNQFIELLSETKHRGAFEQAYIGFSKICLRLWGSPHTELHQLPMRWIKELINAITGGMGTIASSTIADRDIAEINLDKLCVTRRSAGIPFIIQALITSELQVSSTKGLQFCMKALLELCRSNTTSSQTRTHSLNILRSLFRSTDLGETVGEFVSEGIMCAINGYEAESWSERNSSTLLFSALMVRVFGVQRTKDSENLNIRNKMTGRIFFLRYPVLYDYFVLELEKASKIIIQGTRSKKLHPLLLLLSRLYPSALEGSESNLKLSRFVPLVSICSGCAEFQTRFLAAKIVSIIVSPDLMFDRICLLLESLNRSNNRNVNPNSLHGALLQILYLVKTKNPGLVAAATSSGQLNNWIELYTAISNYLFEVKPNFIIYSTILDILLEILARCQHIIIAEDDQFIDDLSNIVDYLLNLTNHRNFYGEPLVFQKIVLLKTFMYLYSDDETGIRSSQCFLLRIESEGEAQLSQEYIQAMLNTILLVLDVDQIGIHCEEYDITPVEVFYFRNICELKPDRLRWLKAELLRSQQLHCSLRRLIGSGNDGHNQPYMIQVKAYLVLSYSSVAVSNVLLNGKSIREAMQTIYKAANNQPYQLRSAMFRCLKRLLQNETKGSSEFTLNVEFLPTLSAAYQSKPIRLTAVECLHIVGRKIFEGKSLNQYINFSFALLNLLSDDDSNIRAKASIVVSQLHHVIDKVKQKPLVATYAQSVYLRLLSKTMIAHKFTLNQIVAVIVVIWILKEQEIEDDSVNIDGVTDTKVFDKNEVNIYGELELVRDYCIVELQHLEATSANYSLESNIDKIQKIVDKHLKQPTCIREFLHSTAKISSKLIGIVL
ncbi:thyroid adenoma-associated protein homolog [Anopheles maculipalpis]|uniref:thyroid adenoma-associated protein homolog n=1 Tax=Anopheles maculipalpis TaxID=1496333 RepID=UPI002158C8DF|nr:thyroid adenoma-associated protein homolog [Anopheles maculipalpis]